MTVINSFLAIGGVFLAAPVVYLASVVASNPSAEDIYVHFYKKKSLAVVSSSSAAATPGSDAELFAKVKVPMKYTDDLKQYQFCLVGENIVASSASQGTSTDCTTYKSNTEEESKHKVAFLFELAHKYLWVQHTTNLYKATNSPASTTTTKSVDVCKGCSCTHQAKGLDCQCTTDAGSTCCCLCCITEITKSTKEKEKEFTRSIKNVSSSWSSVYLSPAKALIYLPDWKEDDFTSSSSNTTSVSAASSSSTSTSPKTMYGSLIYGYINYYYQKIDSSKLNDFLEKSKAQEAAENQSVQLSSVSSPVTTTTEKHFINYPIPLSYDVSEKQLKPHEDSQSPTTTTECPVKLVDAYDEIKKRSEYWKNTAQPKAGDVAAASASQTTTTNIKAIADCIVIGEIEDSKLKQMPSMFNNICACKKP